MLGYCAMGSVLMARPPANITTMASTQAKIGRAMKNSDTLTLLLRRSRGGGWRGFELLRGYLVRVHRRAWLHALNSQHDDLLARGEALAHQPLIADGAIGLDDARHGLVLCIDDRDGGLAARVMGDRSLRHQQAVIVHPFLELLAHEHTGKQDVLRIRENRAQDYGTGARIDRDLRELQLAALGIAAAILEQQLRFGLGFTGLLQLAGRQFTLQP